MFDLRGFGLGQCRGLRGFGSFRAWTQNGLGLGADPKWVGVGCRPKGIWGWVGLGTSLSGPNMG